MILVIVAAMCACLGIGYLIGWLCHSDRAERVPYQAQYPPAAAPRHAVALPLRLRHVAPGTDELAALNAAAELPALGGGAIRIGNMSDPLTLAYLSSQPPLGQLVKPGRATDFIEKMKADTDRWIAVNIP